MRKIIFTMLILIATLAMVAQVDDDTMREEAIRSLSPPAMVLGGPGGEGNGVVGATPASVDVSALGGATYTMPIQVPEGINGMHPNLSIVYNSQSGNGLLGWGWNLGGISAITRTGPTMFHDLATLPVDFEHDRFTLDGQRLMAISGEYGYDQTEYKTEMDGLNRIVSHRAANDTTIGPAWFEVRTPEGLIMEYGRTWDSRIGLQQQHDACLWLLNKVEDRNGNYVEYHYNRGGASYVLSYIKYTGTATHSPCYTVFLDYANREDEEKSFIGNNTIDLRKLLTSIRVLWWDKEIIRYDFEYDEESGHHDNLKYYNRLQKILYTSGHDNPVSYNPTIINWGEYSSENIYNPEKTAPYGVVLTDVFEKVNNHPYPVYMALNNKVKFSGDFNGDGFTDIIFVDCQSRTELQEEASEKTFHLCLNRGYDVNSENKGELCFEQVRIWTSKSDWIYVCDFTGDGKDDYFYYVEDYYYDTSEYPVRYIRMYAFESVVNSDGQFVSRNVAIRGDVGDHHDAYFCSPWEYYSEQFLIGDFVGIGKSEILLSCSRGDVRMSYQDGEIHYESSPQLGSGKFKTGDFDGDGCTEIWHAYRNYNGEIIKFIGPYYSKTIVNNCFLYYDDKIFLGDFNGDGHTDFLFYTPGLPGNDGVWKIWLYKNNQICYPTFEVSNYLRNFGDPGYYGHSIQNMIETNKFLEVADLDGDGKSDIIIRYNNDFHIYYAPWRITGNTTYPAQEEYFSGSNVGIDGETRDYSICVGNFMGRANQSILGGSMLFSKFPHSSHYSVESIIDGMGNVSAFEYDYLIPDVIEPDEDDFYTLNDDDNLSPSTLAASRSIPLPMKALKKVSTYNDYSEAPTASVRYQYKNALVNKAGRGFLGFAGITVNSYVNEDFQGRNTRCFSAEPMWQFCSLVPTEECAYNKFGVLTSKAEYVYSKRLVPGKKVFMPLVDKVWQYNYDVEGNFISKRITENTYETDLNSFYYYNRIVRKTDESIGTHEHAGAQSVSACDFVTTNHTEYLSETTENLSSWVINRPCFVRSERTWRNIPNSVISSQTNYTYDTDNPFLPSQIITYPGGDVDNENGLATSIEYLYDEAGNVTDVTKSTLDGSLPQVSRSIGYSSNYRFPVLETNQLGYESQRHFNSEYGELIRTIDCNGLVNSYWRDDHLGSTDWSKSPYNVYSCIAKRWAIVNNALVDNAPENSAYYIWSRSTDGYPTRVFYDASGRELRSVREGINGEIIYFDTEYDALGRVHKVYEPYFKDAPEPRLYSEYFYDNYDRLYRTDHPDGTCNKTSWEVTTGRITTTNDFIGITNQVQSTRSTSNIMGWTIESMDNGGNVVYYDYYPDGKLRKAGLNPDIEITLQYDDNGNRTTLNDPNYGTVTTRYDAYGQLVITTSPKGDETEYEYDVLGRMVERYETDYSNHIGDYTKWEYNNTGPNKGLLNTIKHNTDEQTIEYVYDDKCRVEVVLETRGERRFKTVYHYNNSTGRVEKVVYPTGFVIGKEYENGHLRNITDGKGNILWHTEKKNAMGQITEYKLGNGIAGTMSYYPETHRLETQVAIVNGNKVQDFYYGYDDFGNLASRTERKYTTPMTESFGYDELNRLKTITLNGVASSMWYDDYGRIGSKMADGGAVFYEADYDDRNRPHAIRGAEIYNNAFPGVQTFDIVYTMFDKVKSIQQDYDALHIDYGFDHERIAMSQFVFYPRETVSKVYVGNCEYIKGPDRARTLTYLTGPMGVFAVYDQLGDLYKDEEGGKTYMHYLLKDHLGSITTITNENGQIEQELSFDAWGSLRNPYTWTGAYEGKPMFDRGFTGHEHHYAFGLINMNGRMYDPLMSSFLSVDNYVQAPDFSQSFNRYAYCLNNPLKYTDPDGEIALTTLAMVGIGVATVMGGYTGYNIAVSKGYGFDDWQTYGYMLGGAAIGFAAGYTGAYLVAGGGFMANTAGIYASSLVNCTGMTMLSGGSYSPPISFGAVSYDPMTGEWGYLGKKGNSPWQNIGYAFGALANLQDVVAGVNGTNIQVKSRKELAGHSELGSYSDNGYYQDGDVLVSVGPNAVVGSSDYDVLLAMENKISIPTDDGVAWELPFVKATLKGKSVSGINEQIIRSDDSQFITTINNVNGKILHNMTNNLNAGRNLINTGNLKYGLFYGCVNYTSRALAMSGVLNVNAFLPVTAPVLLNLELAIRNIGIYASPYLIQY